MKETVKKECVHDNGWKSRKLWAAIVSFVTLVVFAALNQLTMNLLIGLVAIPAIYGIANVTLKKIGVAKFTKIDKQEEG